MGPILLSTQLEFGWLIDLLNTKLMLCLRIKIPIPINPNNKPIIGYEGNGKLGYLVKRSKKRTSRYKQPKHPPR